MSNALRTQVCVDACRISPVYCQQALKSVPSSEMSGWCQLTSLRPTKEGGYPQVSFGGANKFACLQSVVMWAAGLDFTMAEGPGDAAEGGHASHLCHKPLCMTVGHVVPESAAANNSRKGCLVWIDCHHCAGMILLCTHEPRCIKYREGYSSMEDLLRRGNFCRRL